MALHYEGCRSLNTADSFKGKQPKQEEHHVADPIGLQRPKPDVTQATEVWYDPDPMNTIIEEDVVFVKSYYEMPNEELDMDKISPWLLQIELNREMMVDKKLSMADIAEKINLAFGDDLTCIYNDDNPDNAFYLQRACVGSYVS
ncbi:DNA-directed RNA polymerase II subunit 1 [Artemisia annua]|uniref:DNA-directed RNA polymerase II subunit 1 n=1 Tax=Artemisia annua TaxID=35608 RepID=A0A2U1MIL3_ARTAN|nr:DNA-directed RNA polymerase II subunit 1 [Artemisia annua]